MEEILAIVLLFGGGSCVLLAYSPVGVALAERLRARVADDDIEVLRAEVGALRREVADLQERLDFAERLLTDGRSGTEHEGGTAA